MDAGGNCHCASSSLSGNELCVCVRVYTNGHPFAVSIVVEQCNSIHTLIATSLHRRLIIIGIVLCTLITR